MAAGARLGTFDDLLDEIPEGADRLVKLVAIVLRRVILEGLPDAVEVVRLGDKAASFGLGPKKMSECHVYIMPTLRHVNLGFYFGADLVDPDGLLEGSGKKLRHIKVRSIGQAESSSVAALIAQALRERRHALGWV